MPAPTSTSAVYTSERTTALMCLPPSRPLRGWPGRTTPPLSYRPLSKCRFCACQSLQMVSSAASNRTPAPLSARRRRASRSTDGRPHRWSLADCQRGGVYTLAKRHTITLRLAAVWRRVCSQCLDHYDIHAGPGTSRSVERFILAGKVAGRIDILERSEVGGPGV